MVAVSSCSKWQHVLSVVLCACDSWLRTLLEERRRIASFPNCKACGICGLGVMRDQATLCLRNGRAYLSVFIVADDLKGPQGSGIFYHGAKTNHQAPHV